MRVLSLLVGLSILVSSCGVKAPPVAPERITAPTTRNLDCSVYDPECDKEDPNYKPQGKKGRYPAPKDDE